MKSGVDVRQVRDAFTSTLKKKVKTLQSCNNFIGKQYGERDDWLFVTPSLDSTFKLITNLLNHNTGYIQQEKLPLEIAIGLGHFDKWSVLDGPELITEQSVIKFLKTYILEAHRKWNYKNHGKSIKSTFIVLTEEAYNKLDAIDKKFCTKIELNTLKNEEEKPHYFVLAVEKVIQRGKLFNFLEEIHKTGDLSYYRIDEVFVPPNEYETMIESLEKTNILFLVGDPEIGKTYTAVRILWDFFCKGYKPIWYEGSEDDDRKKLRQKMTSVEKFMENTITYFEDPFGKTKFEDREQLRRLIGNFIVTVQNSKSKVIVTSRDEVFKEFNEKKQSQRDIESLTIKMCFRTPSYTKEKMQKLLHSWAEVYDCIWLHNEFIKEFVFKQSNKTLSTPLSLRDFVLESRATIDPLSLKKILHKKSKEVKEAFAEEISQMPKEKVLFLSLINLFNTLEMNQIVKLYNAICVTEKLNSEIYSVDYLLEWFATKISKNKYYNHFEFTHPSYQEGIVRSWNNKCVKNFIIRIVNQFVKNEAPLVRGWTGFHLVKNFEDISFTKIAQELIQVLLSDRKSLTRAGPASALQQYFGSLPRDMAIELLDVIVKDKHRAIRRKAVYIVSSNFSEIPKQKVLSILSNGLIDRSADVRNSAVSTIYYHSDELPKELVIEALNCHEELLKYTNWEILNDAQIMLPIKERVEKSIINRKT